MRVWCVVVAGGSGTRFGGPKQLVELGGRKLVDWAVGAARRSCEGVVLVLPADRVGRVAFDEQPDAVVAGGATRSESVRAGLAEVPADVDVIVVHDAARPLAHPALFAAAIGAVAAGADGALCAVPVVDTLKRVDASGVVTGTVARDGLWAVQTPQAFRAAALRAAHAGGGEATDDGALVEAHGGRVVVVAGDVRNRKVTDPADLALLEGLL